MRLHRLVLSSSAALGLALVPSIAVAQERPTEAPPSARGPTGAFELGAAAGYSQGFGAVGTRTTVGDVAGPGLAGGVGVGYRVSPWWSMSLEGEYLEAQAQQNHAARGLDVNVGVTGHLAPFARHDPWARLSTGYRWLWSVNEIYGTGNNTVLRQGFEIARVEVGLDFRAPGDVALAPVLGIDLNAFVYEDQPYLRRTGVPQLSSPAFNTFVFAGLKGRFDIGGARVPRGVESARR